MINKSEPRANMVTLFAGSLLFQIVQVGAYPILISQLLAARGADSFLIGIFIAISWIAVFAAGPFVPRIISSLGNRNANSLAFLLTITSIALLALPTTDLLILLSSISMGLGLIVRWINCDTLVVQLSNNQTRGRTIGWHEALMGLGIGLGPLLFVGASLSHVVWLCGAIILAGQAAFFMTDTKAAHEQRNESKGALPTRFLATAILMALVATFIAGFIENSSIALLPLYFADVEFSLAVSAILVSAFGFGGTLLQPALGYLADRKSYFFAQMVCVFAICVSGVLTLMFKDVFAIALVALFFLGGAAGGLNTLAVIEAGMSQSSAQVPAAMTAIAMLYTLGSIAGPVASGAVLNLLQNQGMMVLFIAVGGLLGGGLFFHRRRVFG